MFTLIIIWLFLSYKDHLKLIKQKISNIGGEVISINRKILHAGPFVAVMRTTAVYEFKYLLKYEEKMGYVKFGVFTSEWEL